MPSLPSASWSGADSPWLSSAGPVPLHIIFPTRFSAARRAVFAARAATIAGTFSRGRRSPARWRRSAARPRRSGPLRGGRRARRRLAARLRRLAAPLACAAALAGAIAAVAARAEIAAVAPGASGLYAAIGLPVNSVGLAIADVSARLGAGGDKSLLAVEGAL